jgi:hypothetical protein
MSYLADDKTESIHWYCTICSDKGTITGWQDTSWDQRERSAEIGER